MSSEAIGWVFRHSPTTGAAFQVHLAIADSVNDQHENELWMRQANLAKKARVSRESTCRAIKKLVAEGLLEVLEENRGAPSRFRLLTPPGLPPMYGSGAGGGVTSGHTPQSDDLCATVTGGVTDEHTGCDESAQEVCATVTPTSQENPRGSQGDPNTPQPPAEAAGLADPVVVVFETWKQITDHPRAVLDAKRRRTIERAMNPAPKGLGFSLDEILDAVRGWKHSIFHRGDNDRGTVYDDIGLILRDASKVEGFMRLQREPRLAPSSKRVAHERGLRTAAERFLETQRSERDALSISTKELTRGVS